MKKPQMNGTGFEDKIRDPNDHLDVVVRNREGCVVHHHRGIGDKTKQSVVHHPIITRSAADFSKTSAERGSRQ